MGSSWEVRGLDCSNWKSVARRCTLLLIVTPKRLTVTDVHRTSIQWSFCCTCTSAPSHFTAGHKQVTFLTGIDPRNTVMSWVLRVSQRYSRVPFLLGCGGIILHVEWKIRRFDLWRWGRGAVPKRRAPVTQWHNATSRITATSNLWSSSGICGCDKSVLSWHYISIYGAKVHTYIHTYTQPVASWSTLLCLTLRTHVFL